MDLLRSCNLHSYSQIMQTSRGTIVEENSLLAVRCLNLEGTKLYSNQTRVEKVSSAVETYCHSLADHLNINANDLNGTYLSPKLSSSRP